MYHQVEKGVPVDVHAVSERSFSEQMRWLFDQGYQTLPIRGKASPASRKSGKKQIAITFDDGYLGAYMRAIPHLVQFGFTATFFLVPARVGKHNDWDGRSGLAGAPLMNWDQVLEILKLGMGLGAHTCTHPDLLRLPADRASFEISQSRVLIEAQTGVTTESFSYPFSRYNRATMDLVSAAGYQFACEYRTGFVGPAGNQPLALRRTGVLATDTLDLFSNKIRASISLRTAYLWRRIRRKWKARSSA